MGCSHCQYHCGHGCYICYALAGTAVSDFSSVDNQFSSRPTTLCRFYLSILIVYPFTAHPHHSKSTYPTPHRSFWKSLSDYISLNTLVLIYPAGIFISSFPCLLYFVDRLFFWCGYGIFVRKNGVEFGGFEGDYDGV